MPINPEHQYAVQNYCCEILDTLGPDRALEFLNLVVKLNEPSQLKDYERSLALYFFEENLPGYDEALQRLSHLYNEMTSTHFQRIMLHFIENYQYIYPLTSACRYLL